MNSVYLCIDLKTFYASVECVQRGLDPFAAPLVVADPSRGKGAICLAVSPKMKALGVRNRCRIFEIPASIAYITALPRMELYMRTAADIYGIYLRYVAPGDIHVYSIDEAFLDITPYLRLYGLSARELVEQVLSEFQLEVLSEEPVEYRCYCSRDRMERALISLGPEELQAMIDEQGSADLTCRFCDNVQHFSREDLEAMVRDILKKKQKN